MGDQGATGGAWGARDEASWWSGGAGEIQNQQINEEITRSTEGPTHQMYTYKITSGFSNNPGADSSTTNYDYRIMQGSNSREESSQQQWWYSSGSVDANQSSSSPTQRNQSNPDNDQGNQRANNTQQQNHQSLQQQEQQQAMQQQQNQMLQQQSLQQMLHQQSQESQGQTLQQMLHQQNQQQQQALQQSIQQTLQVSQAQAQAIVQAQQALQEHVAQTMQQANLHEQMQAVQQQQLQAALQRQQTNTLQALNQSQSLQGPRPRMPRAKAVNKPRGRMTAYAFFVQTCREEHKKKHPDENVVFAAFSKKCAERWNTMNEKEKQRFQEMAEQDKKRYELEMQNYVPPVDAKVRGRKRQQLKDPNAPKRSLSAFFWFCNDERSKVKANNPDYTMGDIAKELGRRWAAADPEAKSKYEQLSEQDKQRYDREMTAYKKGPIAVAQQQAQQHAQRQAELQEAADYEDDEYN